MVKNDYQRDEAVCILLDQMLYMPGQKEDNTKIFCSKIANNIIDRIIDEDQI